MDDLILTVSGLLEVLLGIEELSEYEISITETLDGNLQLQVGDSFYEIPTASADVLPVDEDVADSIEEINSEAYDSLESTYQGTLEISDESINSGILKEIVKTLAVGGLARIASKLLRK